VAECFVVAVVEAVGLAVAVTAGAAAPRVGMGHLAPCKVMGHAVVFAVVAGFPARFE
jgi:hypothetical protein